MLRNIPISFFILFFIPFFAGIIIAVFYKAVRIAAGLNTNPIFKFSRISSGLFNSNHSQNLKDVENQNYLNQIDSNSVSLYFGQLLINH